MAHNRRMLLCVWRYSLILVAGCVGEAVVSYQGTVTEGTAAGYEFALVPNSTGGAPIAGATVNLCVDDRCTDARAVDAAGAYGPVEEVFGGFVGHDTRITVTATGPNAAVEYSTIYEDTTDPRDASGHYLNFVLPP